MEPEPPDQRPQAPWVESPSCHDGACALEENLGIHCDDGSGTWATNPSPLLPPEERLPIPWDVWGLTCQSHFHLGIAAPRHPSNLVGPCVDGWLLKGAQFFVVVGRVLKDRSIVGWQPPEEYCPVGTMGG